MKNGCTLANVAEMDLNAARGRTVVPGTSVDTHLLFDYDDPHLFRLLM